MLIEHCGSLFGRAISNIFGIIIHPPLVNTILYLMFLTITRLTNVLRCWSNKCTLIEENNMIIGQCHIIPLLVWLGSTVTKSLMPTSSSNRYKLGSPSCMLHFYFNFAYLNVYMVWSCTCEYTMSIAHSSPLWHI
mgnify:CR=1 FL=1